MCATICRVFPKYRLSSLLFCRSYLRSFRGVSDPAETAPCLRPPTPTDIVSFAYQIALGMEYLERGIAGRQVSSRKSKIKQSQSPDERSLRGGCEGNGKTHSLGKGASSICYVYVTIRGGRGVMEKMTN